MSPAAKIAMSTTHKHLPFSFPQQTWWFLLRDHVGGLWDWQFHHIAVIAVRPLADRVSIHWSVSWGHLHHLHQPERHPGHRAHHWGESNTHTTHMLSSLVLISKVTRISPQIYFFHFLFHKCCSCWKSGEFLCKGLGILQTNFFSFLFESKKSMFLNIQTPPHCRRWSYMVHGCTCVPVYS